MNTADLTTQGFGFVPAVPFAGAPQAKQQPSSERPATQQAVEAWDARLAHQLIHETMARLAASFPEDYDFDADAPRWSRLEAAIDRACRLQSLGSLREALSRFESSVSEMFAQHEEADLPPADAQLEFWFESLPEPPRA